MRATSCINSPSVVMLLLLIGLGIVVVALLFALVRSESKRFDLVRENTRLDELYRAMKRDLYKITRRQNPGR